MNPPSKKVLMRSLIGVLAWLCAIPLLWGQIDTGAIQGMVQDAQHAVIPGVQVTVINLGTNQIRKMTTDSRGFYHAADLPIGTYEVEVSQKGFKTSIQRGITISVQQIARVDFTLTLGEIRQQVVVTGHAPLLESETAAAGQVIAGQAITGLPLNGRQYVQLARLTAGVLNPPNGDRGHMSGFVANGVRGTMNDFELDGIDNNARSPGMQQRSYDVARPSVDALAQFRVQTHNFSAEFGNAAGAVINASIKSGTNQYHGDLFEFLRNDALDARNYFAAPGQARPKLIRNQFGGTLGGPIVHNHAFFFFSYEGDREIDGNTIVDTVPTLAERQGDFSGLGRTIYDPATTRPNPNGSGYIRDPFPNNIIPTSPSRFDPVAVKVMQAVLPLPNQPGLVNNFVLSPSSSIPANQYIGRIDTSLSSKDTLFGRYFIEDQNQNVPVPFYLGGETQNGSRSQSFVLGETHTISPTMINEFRIGYTRLDALKDIPAQSPQFTQFGFNGIQANSSVKGIPQFTGSELPKFGDQTFYPNQKIPEDYEIKDNLTLIRGTHTLKTGIAYRHQRQFFSISGNARGSFNFNGSFTQDPQARSGSGSGFADYILGLPNTATIENVYRGDLRNPYWGAYFQDDWKVKPNFTLNMGLRYEVFANDSEIHGRQGNFLIGPNKLIYPNNNIPAGIPSSLSMKVPSDLGSQTLMKPDYNNFAPRLGVAWRFTPTTVIRAGAGVYYSQGILRDIGGSGRLVGNPPFDRRQQYPTDRLFPIIVLDQGFPADALAPTTIGTTTTFQAFNPNFPSPYATDYTMDIQHQLPGRILLDVGYSGSKGTQLPVEYNYNQQLPGSGSVASRRPIQSFGNIHTVQAMDNSNYNALIISVQRHFSHRLGFIVSYTHGKAIASSAQEYATDPVRSDHHINWERALTDFDVQNRLVTSFLWQLPFGRNQRWRSGTRVIDGILGGWQFNGIMTLQGGVPFTPSLSTNTANNGGAARPNRLANGNLPAGQRTPDHWFNTSAFGPADASTFQFGNAGRNILTGPGMANFDMSLFKTAHVGALGESGALEFRFEAFNGFNHPQFGLPNTTVDLPEGGVINSLALDMRELQFGMKVLF